MNTVSRTQVSLFEGDEVGTSCWLGDAHNSPAWESKIKPEFFEFLRESYTPNSTGGRKEWKAFAHYKAFRDPTPPIAPVTVKLRAFEYEPHWFLGQHRAGRVGVTGYNANGTGATPFGEPGLPLSGLPPFITSLTDASTIPAPTEINQLRDRSLRAMLPSIKAELSTVNSVIELRDFASLPRTLRNIQSTIRRWDLSSVPWRTKTLRQALHSTADGYLQAKFNILPLLSDISGIGTALSRLERQVNALVTRSGRVQVRHFSCPVTEFQNVSDISDGYLLWRTGDTIPAAFIPYFGLYLSRLALHDPSLFHAQIEYNYNFTRYQIEHAQLLGLLDSLGLNLNPAIIWNAVKWTFVIDWVFGVSRWLDSHKVLNLEPKINIRRYLCSIKRSRKVYTWKNTFRLHPSYPVSDARIALPVVTETAYRRFTEQPSTSSIISSGLTPTEFSLGAALVIARKYRRKPAVKGRS